MVHGAPHKKITMDDLVKVENLEKRKASPSLCLHGAVLVLHISFKALKTLFDGYYLSFVFEDFLTFRLGL